MRCRNNGLDHMVRWIPFGAIGLLALAACSGGAPDPRTDDSPTFGSVLVLADQDLRSVLENEQRMFEAIYADAKLEIRYLPEGKLARAMLNDSIRAVFGYFLPGADQDAYFKTRSLSPYIESIATDAIAVVVSKGCPVDSLSLDEVRGILLNGALDTMETTALFEAGSQGLARSLIDSLWGGDSVLLKGAIATVGVQEMIARVSEHSNTFGFLSFATISDLDNPAHRAVRDQVKLLRISGAAGTPALMPTQGSLADGHYPLRRSVYMIVTEGKSGLGTGFASFVAGHKGQRIILKLGIAPAHVPAREVMIVPE